MHFLRTHYIRSGPVRGGGKQGQDHMKQHGTSVATRQVGSRLENLSFFLFVITGHDITRYARLECKEGSQARLLSLGGSSGLFPTGGHALGDRISRQGLRVQLDVPGDLGIALFLVIAALTEFVDSRVVDLVLPALVEVDKEDDVVTEGGETVERGHLDGEGEEVVDEGVEELVCHCLGGHVRYGLEFVVDEEGWNHHCSMD
jgi:hypothetical protein